jgi:hypothetical protein
VHYNGALTRSIPAQGTASSLTVIASYSAGIVQNGTILSVTPGKDGYSISLLPLGQEKKDDLSNTITLTVHMFALEGLKGEDLVEGLKVSAVTTGIAAESSPRSCRRSLFYRIPNKHRDPHRVYPELSREGSSFFVR